MNPGHTIHRGDRPKCSPRIYIAQKQIQGSSMLAPRCNLYHLINQRYELTCAHPRVRVLRAWWVRSDRMHACRCLLSISVRMLHASKPFLASSIFTRSDTGSISNLPRTACPRTRVRSGRGVAAGKARYSRDVFSDCNLSLNDAHKKPGEVSGNVSTIEVAWMHCK